MLADPVISTNYLHAELEDLIRSDSKIFEFVSSSLAGMWYWDLTDPDEEWLSPSFWTSLGYDPASMPHKASAWQDIIDPSDLAKAKELVGQHLADPSKPYIQTVRYRHKDGHLLTVLCRGMAIRNAEGAPIRMLGVHTDISDQRRVERLLTETNRAARVGSWECDLTSGGVYWSEVTKEIHEVGQDFVPSVEQGVNFYREGWSRDRIQKVLGKAIEEGTPWDEVLELVTATGKYRWVRAVGRAVRFNGKTIRLYGSFQDVHEERLRAKALEASEQLMRSHFELAPHGMAIVGPDGYFERVSRTFVAVFGYSEDELKKLTFLDITHKDDRVEGKRMIGKLRSGEISSYRTEKRYVSKAGQTIWADLSVTSVTDSEGQILRYYAQLVDRSEAKLAEARQQRIAFLEDKAREMEQFAYIASHDLRQPVLTIQGYVQALLEDYGDSIDEGGKVYLDVVEKALVRMDNMIKGLLDYSRLSKAKQLQHVDLNGLLAEVREDLSGLINASGGTLTIDSMSDVLGYPLELRQVFQNLIANAFTYHKDGVAPRVSVCCEAIVGGYQYSVIDNGIGIPDRDQERIFGLFQTSAPKSESKGTGIGLATCRAIIERHNGTIWVESTESEGSTFCFTLLTKYAADE